MGFINELELEGIIEDPRDLMEERERRRKEREAWEWEQADRDYAERDADEYYRGLKETF